MSIDELHNKLAEKDWLIEDLTEVDFLLIAHVKDIMEQQNTKSTKQFLCGNEYRNKEKRCLKQCGNCQGNV